MRRRDVVVGALALGGCASMSVETARRPVVIAHRGASAYRPEHTLSSYRLAITQGADFIEPDLVMTKDGVLVCRHENEISETTNVADHPEFADRRREQRVDNTSATGWWVEDFTLAELKTLRCKERIPQLRGRAHDGQDTIPTFAEALALAREAGVGIYPELKHPSFLRERGLDPVPAFIAEVHAAGGQAAADIMFVQCFETWPLIQLAQMSSIRWKNIQLMENYRGPWDRQDLLSEDLRSDAGLRAIAEYAVGIGVPKSLVIREDAENGGALTETDLVARAHAAGLLVHVWTLRPENYFLPQVLRRGDASAADFLRLHGDFDAEIRAFYAAGVDGVFSDAPDAAVAARN